MWSTNSSCKGLCYSLSPSAAALPVCRPGFGATSGPRTGLFPPRTPFPPTHPRQPAPASKASTAAARTPRAAVAPGTCPLHIGGVRAGGLRAHPRLRCPRRVGQRSPAGLPLARGNGESGSPAMPEGRAAVRLGPEEQPGGGRGSRGDAPAEPRPLYAVLPVHRPRSDAWSVFRLLRACHKVRVLCSELRYRTWQLKTGTNIQIVLTPQSAGG